MAVQGSGPEPERTPNIRCQGISLREWERRMRFNLSADPSEDVDLAAVRADILTEPRERIDELRDGPDAEASQVQDLERLHSLRYYESIVEQIKKITADFDSQ